MYCYILKFFLVLSLLRFTESQNSDDSSSSEILLPPNSITTRLGSLDSEDLTVNLGTRSGLTKLSSKIIGGYTTNTTVHPWFAALGKRQSKGYLIACGATLITSSHLVTAAHCYGDVPASQRSRRHLVLLNLSDRCNQEVKAAPVKEVIIHENYKHGREIPENDIAIIVLKSSVKNTPISLPTKVNYGGSTGIIIGYGYTKVRSLSDYPCYLQEAKIKIFSQRECENSGIGRGLAQRAICAGERKGGVDACDGDSGGPLMVVIDNKYELIGVTSYGEGCGRPNLPGVYTDLTSRGQGAWIRGKLGESAPSSAQTVTSPVQQTKPSHTPQTSEPDELSGQILHPVHKPQHKPPKPFSHFNFPHTPQGHWALLAEHVHHNPAFLHALNLMNHINQGFAFD